MNCKKLRHLQVQNEVLNYLYYLLVESWTTEALDGRAVWKISKRHFFQDIKKSFHGVTQMGPKPHQNFFWKNISTNMVARGVGCFCTLGVASDTLGQYPNSGEVISENMARYAEKWGVNVPRRPQAGGVTLAPHFEAWGPYFPIWPRQSQDILIVLGKMWFSQWNLVFASTKKKDSSMCTDIS